MSLVDLSKRDLELTVDWFAAMDRLVEGNTVSGVQHCHNLNDEPCRKAVVELVVEEYFASPEDWNVRIDETVNRLLDWYNDGVARICLEHEWERRKQL